jgi:membrane protease YdiL (CAAX protease family)
MQANTERHSIGYTVFTVAVLLFALLFPHAGIIPVSFGYTIPVLLLIWWVLNKYGESFANLGFSFGNISIKAAAVGLVAATLLFVLLKFGISPLVNKWLGVPEADLHDFDFIKGNLGGLLFVVLMGWLVGGFYEELVFHGYLFTRLENWLQGGWAVPLSVFVSNLIFGAYHWQLGLEGVIHAFIAGLAYHLLMLRFRRNLWYAFFFHGFYDTIALTNIYLGN